MSEKRYGGPAYGWRTAEELANSLSAGYVRELASDLLAAQAKIAELEADLPFVATQKRVVAAESRIAELEDLQKETVAQGRAEILFLRRKLIAAELELELSKAQRKVTQ